MAANQEFPASGAPEGWRVFISYKRNAEPDESLAAFLSASLARQGHRVFIDLKTPIAHEWSPLIENEITTCDFFVVLLTQASVAPGYVVAETLVARDSEVRTGRPRIVPVRVGYPSLLPLILGGAIGHLQYFEWNDTADNEVLLGTLVQRIGKPDGNEPRPTALLRGDHFIIGAGMWRSVGTVEFLAGTTIVPVTAGEEKELSVTRTKRLGGFRAKILETGALEVAIWKGAGYRAVTSRPEQFIEMIQGDHHKWCFASHRADETLLFNRSDGRKDPIVVSFDQDLVRAAWTVIHERGSRRESFLIVMKDPADK